MALRLTALLVVALVALAEGAIVTIFAVFAFTGDELNILRDLAMGFGAIFVVTVVAASLLLQARRYAGAVIVAVVSAAVFSGLWRFA